MSRYAPYNVTPSRRPQIRKLPVDRRFANLLATWLVDRCMTGAELAAALGLPGMTISHWMNANVWPDAAQVERIAGLLNCDVAAMRATIPAGGQTR